MAGPLRVNIVGAGLVGLSAALALRQQGHDVQVFEAAAQLAPLGAVIVVPPNATRVYERLDFDIEKTCRPLRYQGSVGYKSSGEKVAEWDLSGYERPSWSVHRHDLHTALFERAVSADGPGRPVRVRLGTRVATCDPEAGTLITEDGETHSADLVVGADGIRSSIRTHILGHPLEAPTSGRAAFRALIPTDGHRDELQWLLADGPPGQRGVFASGRRTLLFTPLRDGELISVLG
ncbi:hypothetical protein HDZ31DRAFT_47456, partial [Schizophyllum fasciatum]